MRWKQGRRSNNVEDRRSASSSSMGAMGGLSAVGRILPILLGTKTGRTLLVVAVVVYFGAKFMGYDLLHLATPPNTMGQSNNQQLSAKDQELADFVSVILADTESTWHQEFKRLGLTYQEPTLVLFRNAVSSACGYAQSAMGPFYCPGDHKLYIDLAFYEDMKTKLGAPGDFAQAYVIAHEVGHHVQTLLGISAKVSQAQSRASKEQANQLSVKQELQADCYAGIWGHYANTERQMLEDGDIEEALIAAAAIGDDKLQQQAGGVVRPESFTHGSSKQRVEWFKRGFEQGSVNACNTFK
ncbi:neutral zinc metallopeptidase family protein [Cellvibrio sp. BR]|uniref:KPN_02809 family neutral zinc metallopeptidase n=1 Tax=Cellvibrio sp. BR TaxID=1134474 RepID=UPI0002600E0D|nr:neutral zinc metallopeptidase [Cellvibrio sp. BR]EIK45098.1 neutral zinc metallopeptidase family protein [Cellvibrio sp. BR]